MCGNPNSRLLIRLLVDFFVLLGIYTFALVGLPYWLKHHFSLETASAVANYSTKGIHYPLTQARRGFFCSDDSLRYSYKRETWLNRVHITILTIALPIAIILIVEMLRTGFSRYDSGDIEPQKFTFVGLRIPAIISECYQVLGCYLFGLGLLLIAIAFIKHWTGRLRPYFFDVCQPQMTDNTSCDDDENFGIYIEDYSCSDLATVSTDLLVTLRQSFPSRFAACTAYSLGFLILYLHVRLRSNWLRLLRLILQFLGATIIALVSIERVNSMRSHLTDVWAGVALGIFFAAFICVVVLQLFQHIAETRDLNAKKSIFSKSIF